MRSRSFHVLSGLALVSATLLTGCKQDTLSSGSQNLNMTYTPDPSGAGRFDTGTFKINKIEALPADPELAALYGAERLIFRFTPFEANLTAVAPVTYSNIALSTGTYIVTRIEFTPPALSDNNLAPPPYAACIDGLAVIDAQSTTPNLPEKFLFTSPPSDLTGLSFSLGPGQTNLALTVNVPGLIAGYQAAFTCQMVACPGCPVDPKPTLTSFNTPSFRAALLANITIK